MLYKLICIKNISNNETLSNISEIVIKYLNQINNFLGSLNKELLYKFFNSIEEFLKLNFRNPTAQATTTTEKLRVRVHYECIFGHTTIVLRCFDLVLFKTEAGPLSMRIQPRF